MRLLERVRALLGPSTRERRATEQLRVVTRALRRHRDAIDFLVGRVVDASLIGAVATLPRSDYDLVSVTLREEDWLHLLEELYGAEHPTTERFRARVRVARSALESP